MKIFKFSLSLALSTSLLLVGCGGGGGSSSTSDESQISGSLIQIDKIPSTNIERLSLFNKRTIEYSDQTNAIYSKVLTTLKDVSNNFTKNLLEVDHEDGKKLYEGIDSIDAMIDDNILMAYNVVNLIYPKKITKGVNSREKRLLGTFVLVSGIAAILGGTIGQAAIDANKRKSKITTNIMSNMNKNHLAEFSSSLGLPKDTTNAQLLDYYAKQGYRKQNAINTRMHGFVIAKLGDGGFSSDTAIEYNKKYNDNTLLSAYKLGEAGVDASVGLHTTAAGGQLVDKAGAWIGNNIGMSSSNAKNFGTVVDLAVGYAGYQPTDIVKKIVVSQSSSRKKKKTIPRSPMTTQKAINTLKGGSSSAKDIEDARNRLQQDIALKANIGKRNGDGSVEVELGAKMAISTINNVKAGGRIKIPKIGEKEDIVLIGDRKIPTRFKDIIVNSGDLLNLGMTTLEEFFAPQDPSFTISSKVSKKDVDSITYIVSATLKGIKKPTSIKISVTNAATSSITKTLYKDGTVSWSVTVLEKDATIALTRLDTKITKSLTLKGVGSKDPNDLNIVKYLEVYETETGVCRFYGDKEPIEAPSSHGDNFYGITDNGLLIDINFWGDRKKIIAGTIDVANNVVRVSKKTDNTTCSGGGTIQSGSFRCTVTDSSGTCWYNFRYRNGKLVNTLPEE